jgi:RNA polymerase sigma-70 factor (ECF subfamily)
VVDEVTGRLERQQVRHCLDDLTELQRQAVTLAYYQGHSYAEVADLLATPLPTVKSRMRDGLIRLRDCLGVEVATR